VTITDDELIIIQRWLNEIADEIVTIAANIMQYF
jgi:hypothetical protein